MRVCCFPVRDLFARALPFLLVGALCAALTGCEPEPLPVDDGPVPLVFDPLGVGQQIRGADSLAVREVVRDSAAWAAFGPRLLSFRPIDGVDFSQRMILVAGVPVNSGGHILTFQSVEQDSAEIVATYLLTVPSDDCVIAMGNTTPYHAIAATRSDLPVRFEEERETISCALD